MKNTKSRSIILYFLIFTFFIGIGFFIYDFANNASIWAFSPINRHLSENSLSGGKILDANGVVLAQTVNGKRIYNEDENIRKAMLHVVGDGSVLIPTSIQSRYSTELFGYNAVMGFGAPKILSTNKNVNLTLDSGVCSEVSRSFKDKKGAAVAYNYLTGEVLCMVSLPTYDVNNRPDLTKNEEKYEGVYLNRVISSSYTPGSIFKIFTTAAGIDYIDGIENRKFSCNKVKIIDGEKVTCMKNHGKINLKEGFSKSCDIVFSDIGIELGKSKMKKKLEEFGFNNPQYFDGIEIAKSEYDASNASAADLGWSAIGQYTDRVNPMHMLKIMGAIANKGIPVEPFLVKSVSSVGDVTSSVTSKHAGKRMMNVSTADKLKEIMRYTMKNQYGDSLFPGTCMCAKTGTAEVGEGKLSHGWMVGFSYDEKFPVAFAVVVEHGDFGIKSAGPIASVMLKSLHSKFITNKYI